MLHFVQTSLLQTFAQELPNYSMGRIRLHGSISINLGMLNPSTESTPCMLCKILSFSTVRTHQTVSLESLIDPRNSSKLYIHLTALHACDLVHIRPKSSSKLIRTDPAGISPDRCYSLNSRFRNCKSLLKMVGSLRKSFFK